jgi:hypothetical protein
VNEELPFSSAGSFYRDENEDLQFKTVSLPGAYFPEVVAERVIHPDVAHNILVGDTETNSAAMTELLNTGEEKKRFPVVDRSHQFRCDSCHCFVYLFYTS